ncbi:MAG: AAA family ATPase [Pseudomonadota bacterium]|nr:AAA family ATPase [Pseudomonadota bacterium]
MALRGAAAAPGGLEAVQEEGGFYPAVADAQVRREAPLPERRRITVLFCDLVGSTELSVQIDPEDYRRVIRAYQATCAKVIQRFDGVTARYQGDGIMVDFGFPQAHEDDPERAVLSGLGIVKAMAGFNAAVGLEDFHDLAVRIGIATGLAVVGDVIGEGGPAEEMAIAGPVSNLAARLQGLAVPNSVVIGAETRERLGGLFEYQDLGCHPLKGFAEPVPAWRVVRPRNGYRPDLLHEKGLVPLVGREEEMQLLLRRWELAKRGEGQVVLLSGEAGIGKSRIIQALREHIGGEPHHRIRLQCSPYHTNSALHPFIGALERAAGFGRDDAPEQKLAKLEALVAATADPLDEVVPLLAALLSLPRSDRYPPPRLTAQQQRTRTQAALVRQMEAAAGMGTLLVMIEDVHWIDPTSRELLDMLIGQAQSARALVIITFRPDFAPPAAVQPHVTLLALRKLSHEQGAALVERVAGGKKMPGLVTKQIIAKTDGVPLFIEELTKTILASGLLKDQGERYVLEGPLPPLAIPANLQDSLLARLDRLGAAKEVAQMGSAIGREFSHELLAAVGGVTDAELNHALGQLAEAEIISQHGAPPEAIYTFKHALLQDAAYQSLLKSSRQALHGRIAQVLEERFADCTTLEPEILAHHYTEAGLAEPAVNYWDKAGRRALERSANLEALGHLSQGLQLLARLPESAQRDHKELGLQIALGAAYRVTKGFGSSEVEHSFARARALCTRVDDPLCLIDALRGLYACYYVRGELTKARDQAEQVAALAGKSGHPLCRMLGNYLLGAVLFWQGEFTAARRELETALALYDPDALRDEVLSWQMDPGTAAANHLSWTLWILGYPEQALRLNEDTIAKARALGQPFTLAMALTWGCWTGICCGRYGVVKGYATELRSLTTENSFAYLGACATVLEGQMLIAREHYEEGLARMQAGFEEFRAVEAGVGMPWAMSMPIAACLRLGRLQEGAALLERAFAAIERSGEHHWEAELHRLKAELLLAQSPANGVDAEACLRRALAVARQQGARSLELRTAISYARLLRRQGRRDRARRVLAEACDGFAEGFATADLRRARALLDDLN